MRKILCLGVMLFISAFALSAFAAPTAPADGLKMNLSGKKEVVFNHSTHAKVQCVDCHHLVNGAEDYRPCATAGCHDVTGTADKSVNSYYLAMHKANSPAHNSCVSCHTAAAGADKDMKKALAGCVKSKCHP